VVHLGFLDTVRFQPTGRNLDATSLGNNVNRFIQGAEITLFNPDGVEFALVQTQQTGNALVSVGAGGNHSANQFTGFFQVQTSGSGTIPFLVSGICGPKSGAALFVVIISFF